MLHVPLRAVLLRKALILGQPHWTPLPVEAADITEHGETGLTTGLSVSAGTRTTSQSCGSAQRAWITCLVIVTVT